MAGPVPAIRRGTLPVGMAGTGPAMMAKTGFIPDIGDVLPLEGDAEQDRNAARPAV